VVKVRDVECDRQVEFEIPWMNEISWKTLPSPPKPPTPQVSVLLAFWNRPAWIMDLCLKSLVDQDFPPESFEILVVDDATEGENANTAREKVAEYRKKYPAHHFEFIRLKRSRCFSDQHPLYVACKKAKGWIVILHQPDIIFDKNVLESAWRHLNHDGRTIVNTVYAQIDGKTMQQVGPSNILAHLHQSGAAYKKEWMEKIQGRNETMIRAPGDIDFLCSVVEANKVRMTMDMDAFSWHVYGAHTPADGSRKMNKDRTDGKSRLQDRRWTESGKWGELEPGEIWE